VFHVQLRQFPNQARAFNLTREVLDARILAPWVAGQAVAWDDRKWSPEKARLTIYEGPELKTEEMGLGRGWANATRTGQDVTDRLLTDARRPSAQDQALGALRDAIVSRTDSGGELRLPDLIELATELYPESRASDRLAIAEQAVWDLLHLGSIALVSATGEVERDRWQSVLLAWATWTGQGDAEYVVVNDRHITP
jgi:hypothetical protein